MDEQEQIFVVKFLWLQGLGGKPFHTPVSDMLGESTLSLSTV
jgi:hypothetical protein